VCAREMAGWSMCAEDTMNRREVAVHHLLIQVPSRPHVCCGRTCDRASLDEFNVNVENSTYQFLLRNHSLRAHATDMGCITLMSVYRRGRGVSTPTVLIDNLAGHG
jgi:hypothetical protein